MSKIESGGTAGREPGRSCLSAEFSTHRRPFRQERIPLYCQCRGRWVGDHNKTFHGTVVSIRRSCSITGIWRSLAACLPNGN